MQEAFRIFERQVFTFRITSENPKYNIIPINGDIYRPYFFSITIFAFELINIVSYVNAYLFQTLMGEKTGFMVVCCNTKVAKFKEKLCVVVAQKRHMICHHYFREYFLHTFVVLAMILPHREDVCIKCCKIGVNHKII